MSHLLVKEVAHILISFCEKNHFQPDHLGTISGDAGGFAGALGARYGRSYGVFGEVFYPVGQAVYPPIDFSNHYPGYIGYGGFEKSGDGRDKGPALF